MKVFISGGSKNGKSTFGENEAVRLARESGSELYYIATMIASDDEDVERIERHRQSRAGKGFKTLEIGVDMGAAACGLDAGGTYLLDSVTALLSNEMFRDGQIVLDAHEKVAADLIHLAEKVENVVFVSDYIYSDARLFDEFTEGYRKGLAYIDRSLAAVCDRVCEVSFGSVMDYKETK